MDKTEEENELSESSEEEYNTDDDKKSKMKKQKYFKEPWRESNKWDIKELSHLEINFTDNYKKYESEIKYMVVPAYVLELFQPETNSAFIKISTKPSDAISHIED